jgi:hypothetical protein
MGSLLYSHRDVQIGRLCDKLSRMSGYNMLVSCKVVDMGRREPGREPIRLIHIECPAENKQDVQRSLEAMYNSNCRKNIVLGIKMRFIYDMHNVVGMYGNDKTQKILDHQMEFSKSARSVNIPGLTGAYNPDKRSLLTIADCGMDIISRVNGKKIFHSLDQPFGVGTPYILICITAYATNAWEVICGLATYLAH